MYCTYCGSKSCYSSNKLCIFSDEVIRKIIIPFIEKTYFDFSVFNNFYVFLPEEQWDSMAISSNLPTLQELKELYPSEDLEELMFLILDNKQLSPEIMTYYTQPQNTEEKDAEDFSEFIEKKHIDTSNMTRLTMQFISSFNNKPLRDLPFPVFYETLVLERKLL